MKRNKFATRVVLYNGGSKDYEMLHEAMKNEGLAETITSVTGTEYQLPEDQYYNTGNYT